MSELGGNHNTQMGRAGVPRVYVPISLPDSSAPAYAVLEFVGFSSPTALVPPSSPAMLCLPPVVSSSSPSLNPSYVPSYLVQEGPLARSHRSASVIPVSVPPNLPIHPRFEAHHDSSSQVVAWAVAAAGGPPQFVHQLDSPPLSPSTTVSSKGVSSNAKSRDERKPLSVEAPQIAMAKLAPVMASASSIAKKAAQGNADMGGVSISQTERETIVHTSSSNFKDVVRQLTGASSDDQDLMPVTLPARLANRAATTGMGGGEAAAMDSLTVMRVDTSKANAELGLRKAPLKLHERRKALRNLERLSTTGTSCGGRGEQQLSSSPLSPSPVTPLASDFERFCNATTPTASQSSHSALMSSPRPPLNADDSSHIAFAHQHRVPSQAFSQSYQCASQPQPPPPDKRSPTLLNLFPESPLGSPRDL